jgi:hypothetical protein
VEGVDNTIFPVSMEVDYVRIYQTPSQIEKFVEGPARVAPRQQRLVFSSRVKNASSYEWQVPDGARIVEGAGEQEITVDWGCQQGEVGCTIHAEGSVYEGTHQVEVVEPRLDGPLFYSASDDPLFFSVEQMSQTTYQWYLPEGADLLAGEGTDSVEVDWPRRADSLQVKVSNSCGNYTLHHQVWSPDRQYPFPDPADMRILPDTIDPTHYDYGGEGVAYHDWNATNEGQGIRQDEGVDTQMNDEGHGNIGWINEGEWVEYSFRVEQETAVKLILRMASNEQTNGSVDVLVNGETATSTFQAENTGGWNIFREFESSAFTLTPADSILRLEFQGSGFNLGRIVFSRVETGLQEGPSLPSLRTYPNPAGSFLYLSSSGEIHRAEVYDLTGRCVESVALENSLSTQRLRLAGLPPGMYLLRVQYENGHITSQKFLKK